MPPFANPSNPAGVAVDDKGDVHVTDGGSNRVSNLATGASTATEVPFAGVNTPPGAGVEGAGTVYLQDLLNVRTLKLAAE